MSKPRAVLKSHKPLPDPANVRTNLPPPKTFPHGPFPSAALPSALPLRQQVKQNNSFCHTIASSLPPLARTALFFSFLPSLSSPHAHSLFFFLLDHRNSTKTRAGSAEWHRPVLLWCVFVMSALCGVGWCLCSPALWWL